MKPAYLIIIPALVIGWVIGSFTDRYKEEGLSSAASGEKATSLRSTTRSNGWGRSSLEAPTTNKQCQQALEDLVNQSELHPMVQRALLDRVLRAWLEIDPAEALSYAEKQVRHRFDSSLGNDLFRVWVDLDPEGAKQAFSVASPALIESCYQSFCIDLAKKNPAEALDFMASRQWVPKGAFDQRNAIAQIYSDWAMKDPHAALARAGAEKEARKAALIGWATIEPMAAWESAWDSASKSKSLIRNDDILISLAHLILPENPELYGKYSGYEKGKATQHWVRTDFEGAREAALSLPETSGLRLSINRRLANAIAISDPERAIALFQQNGGSETSSYRNSGIFKQAFVSLNSRDPDRARVLLSEIPEQHRTIALGGILTNEFAANSAEATLRAREFLDNPSTRELVLPALERALSWGHGGGNHDLTQIVAAIPELRPKIKGYLLEGWTRVAPEAAASFLAEEAHRHAELGTSIYPPAPDPFQGEVILNTGSSEIDSGLAELSFSKPEFTSEWINTLPTGNFQNHAAGSLATNWARFDKDSAEAWVQSLPEGPMRTQAEESLAKPVNILSFEERRGLREAKSNK